MKEQSYSNHARIVTGYHRVGTIGLLILIIGSVVNIYLATPENLLSAALIFLSSLVLFIVAAYTRLFPLKAQDRAIRAEENLRYYAMTGKLLPRELSVGQIVALRFASDEEFVELVNKAVSGNMTPKEIKQAIRNWRADHHRV